jgi:hypothetical protein
VQLSGSVTSNGPARRTAIRRDTSKQNSSHGPLRADYALLILLRDDDVQIDRRPKGIELIGETGSTAQALF